MDRGHSSFEEIHPEPLGGVSRAHHRLLSALVVRVIERHGPTEPRNDIPEKLKALGREVHDLTVDAREPTAGFPKALDKADGDRVGPCVEHDRYALRRALARESRSGRDRTDQVYLLIFKPLCRRLDGVEIVLHLAHVEYNVLSFLEPQLPEAVL